MRRSMRCTASFQRSSRRHGRSPNASSDCAAGLSLRASSRTGGTIRACNFSSKSSARRDFRIGRQRRTPSRAILQDEESRTMLQFRSVVGPALIIAAAAALPADARANTVVVAPGSGVIITPSSTIIVTPAQNIAPISQQYALQSELLQQQLSQSLQRQLDQSQLRIRLDQQFDRILLQQNIQNVNEQLQRNLFEQRLLLLERDSPIVPAAVGGST